MIEINVYTPYNLLAKKYENHVFPYWKDFWYTKTFNYKKIGDIMSNYLLENL